LSFVTESTLKVKRINNGEPIITPTTNWWEDGVTFNPGVIYLERSPGNDHIIANIVGSERLSDPRLQDGAVAIYYRARPLKETDPDRAFARSFSGLAICSPKLEMIYRHNEPVILPGESKDHYDYVGVEDGRIHRFGDYFYYLYCGVSRNPGSSSEWPVKAQLCLAKSKDLLNWEKLGDIPGNVNTPKNNNKDGVFFPEKIDGRYFMLHRPCYDSNYSTYAMALAKSENIEGPWYDMGTVKYASPNPKIAKHIWVGAGAVPISLGKKRFLVIYHRGHILNSGQRWYDLHAAVYNFNNFDPAKPDSLIEKRLEKLLVPETKHEKVAQNEEGVGNVVFTCGCYEYQGQLYIVYGGADCCTLAAKVDKQELLDALEFSDK
jgi:predicted GH43/DUF377 family glycosyl hydrolase